ncbi:hypothetical protein F4779DRAFT_294455 [Xylariaceae sp. FL0662B]|nr:hypothetical protein F4779DRAFT_294455 [Xylariaceae sp. FL0662B]
MERQPKRPRNRPPPYDPGIELQPLPPSTSNSTRARDAETEQQGRGEGSQSRLVAPQRSGQRQGRPRVRNFSNPARTCSNIAGPSSSAPALPRQSRREETRPRGPANDATITPGWPLNNAVASSIAVSSTALPNTALPYTIPYTSISATRRRIDVESLRPPEPRVRVRHCVLYWAIVGCSLIIPILVVHFRKNRNS